MTIRRDPAAAMGLLVSALSTTPYAQDKSFPSRPVDIIVPSSPGGVVDLFFACSRKSW